MLSELASEKPHMLETLRALVNEKQSWLRVRPHDFREGPDDAPMIDIRLCVERDGEWIFRTGSSDYDQRHSQFCGASCISRDTKPDELLNELLEQVEAQASEVGA